VAPRMSDSNRRREAKSRRRAHRTRARRQAACEARPSSSGIASERETVMMIGMMQDEAHPPCSGPIIVHTDGSAECHGCDGITTSYHPPGTLYACDVPPESEREFLVHRCRRCR
jgi:hypothetical protein